MRLAEAAASLRTALELWRGPPLEGIASDYVQRSATLLADARLSAIEERVRLDLELGRHDEIGNELRGLVTEYPLRERLYGFLMLALYRSGHQAEALEVCRRARVTLIDEVGIDLSPKLQNLERAMLNRDPSLDLPADIGRPPSGPAPDPLGQPAPAADHHRRLHRPGGADPAGHPDPVRRPAVGRRRDSPSRSSASSAGAGWASRRWRCGSRTSRRRPIRTGICTPT